jgi:small subunit ribosomal protein S18
MAEEVKEEKSELDVVEKVESAGQEETATSAESPDKSADHPQSETTQERKREYTRRNTRQRRTYFRRKVCKLCARKIKTVDYKDVDLLRRFVTDRGKILPRRITGTCAKHQRMLAREIKRARMIALLPFVSK